MRKKVMGLALIGLMACLMASAAWSQDFQKNYPLPTGGTVSISSVSGDIAVTGYDGASVSVMAYREGRDKDMVQIVDQSTPDHISLSVQYPRSSGSVNASVRFVVQVPRMVNYAFDKLTTASGDIAVSGVTGSVNVNTASGDVTIGQVAGELNARSASGDLKITQVQGNVQATTASGDVTVNGVSGAVSASTASGDVDVELSNMPVSGDLKFSSASGDVTVRAPAQLNAAVEMSTASGSIKTDFPLNIEELENHGQKATGQLGLGTVKLKISTASGDLHLVRS